MQIPLDGDQYQRNFRNSFKQNFVLRLGDSCTFCSKQLMGTKFARFPCGHMFHVSCLKPAFIEANQTVFQNLSPMKQNNDEFYTQSCPLCGFSSVSQCQELF